MTLENVEKIQEEKFKKPRLLTDEILIQEFNSEELTALEIGRKYNMEVYRIKSAIQRLQKDGKIGYKNRAGKIISPPGVPPNKNKNTEGEKSEEKSLEELLKEASTMEDKGQLSTYHKALIIEIIHKLVF